MNALSSCVTVKRTLQHSPWSVLNRFSSQYNQRDRRGYYEVLGVSPKATRAQIKSAYYKLSMLYHPDKNKESEMATLKFREISEAYEVLGNYNLRKKYDRGILKPRTVDSSHVEVKDEYEDFYKSREVRTKKPPPPRGRTPIYNFDEFYKMHYETTFERDNVARQKYKFVARDERKQKINYEVLLLLFSVVAMLGYVQYELSGLDRPKTETKSDV